MRWLVIVIACLVTGACDRSPVVPAENMMAFVPVYASPEELNAIAIEEARPTVKAGKIYVYQHYVFQNEQYKGIHIIDNSDPVNPVKTAFLSVPFNTEMAIRNNYLYANSVNDLVVIDITDLNKPQVVSTTKDAFPVISQTYPPESGYFVCPDPNKGVVVDWVLENVDKPTCRR